VIETGLSRKKDNAGAVCQRDFPVVSDCHDTANSETT
jgi:hypothetical protein